MPRVWGVVGVALWAPNVATAATYTVCASGCGYTTLLPAYTAAGNDDVVEIRDSGTYAGFDAGDNIRVTVTAAVGQTPTINTRVRVTAGTATFDGVRFSGSTSHCLEFTGSDVVVTDSTFDDCSSTSHGGAVYASVGSSTSTLTLTNVVFQNNAAGTAGNGGHIYTNGKVNVTATDVSFTSGFAPGKGGAIYVDRNGQSSVLRLTRTAFDGNSSGGDGGAVWSSGSNYLYDSRFVANTAGGSGKGGAVFIANDVPVEIVRDVFCGNVAGGDAGGAYINSTYGSDNSLRLVQNSLFIDNTTGAGGKGGGLYASGKGLRVWWSTFAANSAPGSGAQGGAVYSDTALTTSNGLEFNNNIVAYNTSTGTGGLHAAAAPASTLYDAWASNTVGDANNAAYLSGTGSMVLTDPGFNGFNPASPSCAPEDLSQLYLEYNGTKSPLIDKGYTSGTYKDPDNSASDIGAFGGPKADPTVFQDADADGYKKIADCDDANATISPGDPELCSTAADDDCDGVSNESDATDASSWYADVDADTYGGSTTQKSCLQPVGYVSRTGDCDDANKAAYPGNTERCSTAFDDDCDSSVNEPDATDASTWYVDADKDTYGTSSTTKACLMPAGYAARSGDCNDSLAAVSPAGTEVCSTAYDDDCDTVANENDAIDAATWYQDADKDTYGNANITSKACAQPVGYVSRALDCYDGDSLINPGRVEVCNGIDENCSGQVDEGVTIKFYADADADGYGVTATTKDACTVPAGYAAASGDCNDANAAVSPGDPEVCGNNTDDNCDGKGGAPADDDADGLIWSVEQLGGGNDCAIDTDADGVDDRDEYNGVTPLDSDGDGVFDVKDTDDDNDTVPTADEVNANGAFFDTDRDGIPNHLDSDDDGDNVATKVEALGGSDPLRADTDGDFVQDGDEWGGDLTGAPRDTDADGTVDVLDDDDDNDGLSTELEGDTEYECDAQGHIVGDGTPSFVDTDSDGDGKADADESNADADGDGLQDWQDCNDNDGATADSDGDGIPNREEIRLGLNPASDDTDDDGVLDGVEAVGASPADTDGDGFIDANDTDDDGDSFSTAEERGNPEAPTDTDGDGIPNYLDSDDDGDGVPSGVELDGDIDSDGDPNHLDDDDTDGSDGDADGDGLPNWLEREIGTSEFSPDSDGDGIPDRTEVGADATAPVDTDGDGFADAQDPDDDDDGVPTREEGSSDVDHDGVPAYLDTDSDGDGARDDDPAEDSSDVDCDGVPARLDADPTDGPCAQPDRVRDDAIDDTGVDDALTLCATTPAGALGWAWIGLLAWGVRRRR